MPSYEETSKKDKELSTQEYLARLAANTIQIKCRYCPETFYVDRDEHGNAPRENYVVMCPSCGITEFFEQCQVI